MYIILVILVVVILGVCNIKQLYLSGVLVVVFRYGFSEVHVLWWCGAVMVS